MTPDPLCHEGICASDAPPVVGDRLTGCDLTIAEAARRLEAGEDVPLTDVQRRIVEEHVAGGRWSA